MKIQIECSIIGVFLACAMALGGPMPGAIFTTMPDGSRVNANIYTNAYDVYLDGGPGPNAPPGAAGLPEGDYYFQVTDPSGKKLLSEDPVQCRRFHVNAWGVIEFVESSVLLEKYRGKWLESFCEHLTGKDQDYGDELGAITVQLMPFQETSNKGGVYKAWVTPVEQFVGDPSLVDNQYRPPNFHGFIARWSKTDNFKVHIDDEEPPPELAAGIIVNKFVDVNANGWFDAELDGVVSGWPLSISDTLTPGVTNIGYTPYFQLYLVQAPFRQFTVTVTEEILADWFQTALLLNGNPLLVSPTVDVFFDQDHTTNVVDFGNMTYGDATGIKFYDRNANGVRDEGEPPVEGFLLTLSGTDILGTPIDLSGYTDGDGMVRFEDLLPGAYLMTEVLPPEGWFATTPTSALVHVLGQTDVTNEFGNAAIAYAGFGTKGFWHNKNGLALTTQEDLAFLNDLSPWSTASDYFGAGDEPLNGRFEDGTPVAAAHGVLGEELAPAGSALAEQSQFLIDPNAGGDPREQLAQQLDAFIMNIRHALGGGLVIQLPSGEWVLASGVIADAVLIWEGTDAGEQNTMAALLDALNNSNAVPLVPWDPIPVVY